MKSENFVLVVDDSEHDYEALRRACDKSSFDIGLKHCSGGLQALDYLYNEDQSLSPQEHILPSLILLDLSMPGMGGFAFLETIKDDKDFKHIPIIVLSVSENPDDVKQSYEHGASGYFIKPLDINDTVIMVNSIMGYWFSFCRLPS